MRPVIHLFALVALSLLVSGHSRAHGPVLTLSHPHINSLQILPRTPGIKLGSRHPRSLLSTDSFRLSLDHEGETFNLHLTPTEYLVHPAARVEYYDISPVTGFAELKETGPLTAQDVLAFSGHVLSPTHTAQRFREDAAGGLSSSSTPTLGWARILVHPFDPLSGEGPLFEGSFQTDGVVRHVMLREKYDRLRNEGDAIPAPASAGAESRLVVFRDSDILPSPNAATGGHTCAHDHLPANYFLENPLLRSHTLAMPSSSSGHPMWEDMLDEMGLKHWKRDDIQGMGGMNISSNFANEIGDTSGCPKEQKIVYLGVAADCTYVQKYGSQTNATTQILNDLNQASALYKQTFNISLGIVSLSVQSPVCPNTTDPAFPWNVPCSNSVVLNDRLNLISAWRGAKGAGDGAGLWHLMSGCPTGEEVGVAWLGVLCQTNAQTQGSQTVSGVGVTTPTMMEWQVVSHEIGHNFGSIHDCTSGCALNQGCCPFTTSLCDANAEFIMNPVSMPNQTAFSKCTVGNICSLMANENTTCLVTPSASVHTISLQMCGNGIVEPGEECDPGLDGSSTCCDPQTCKFQSGAVCDPSNSPCCSSTCQFSPSTQVCRPAVNSQCDTPEMCTGNSGACPPDVTTPDRTSCGLSGMACASGLCTSLTAQCQSVGASLNLSTACPQVQTSCSVSCQDPTNANQCIILQSQLIAGSPCGYGGKCYNNACQPGSISAIISAWYRANLQIAIPVTVVVGILILLVLIGIITWIRRCCVRNSSRKIPPSRQYMAQVGNGYGTYPGYVPPPGMPPGPMAPAAAMTSSRRARYEESDSVSTATYRPPSAKDQNHSRFGSSGESVVPLRPAGY
ncbi:hypothetical protein DACRYDRAFT_69951 [Dacryopinax primogenitus]|uniref:Disintegrin and metalloproteinase domain-containing protein B n=1 Tax=Dacryopinax primogenitus (strain DJM 731) TaxID=1858805 RepID=M5FTU5_DACPD|nr:uncharacterized protein DACRYDRAFT_69951 [Dacryopinax primogenitus]EJT98874.1 hypothetical protein DACRYDRAFT_69951 [Dacryopinax primogenitus]